MTRYLCLFAGRSGFLFAEDAGLFDRALFVFLLADDQEVPRLVPPFLVESERAIVEMERPVFTAGGVRIVPARALRAPRGGRMLVERGDVVAHPDTVGEHPDWRYDMGHSFDSIKEWKEHLERSIRGLRTATVVVPFFCVIYIALPVWAVILAVLGGFRILPLTGAVIFIGAFFGTRRVQELVSLVRDLGAARRARRVLREAEAVVETAGTVQFMRLWWGAGHGQGPVAIATLSLLPHGPGNRHVPVIGLAAGMLSNEFVPVVVRERASGAPLIEADGVLLWPADRTLSFVGSAQRALDR